eukprot:jgi/Bigna1/140308/aug1.55_g15016
MVLGARGVALRLALLAMLALWMPGGCEAGPTEERTYRPEDTIDCVACDYVWSRIEMMIGDAQNEACEDMLDMAYGMISDYMVI